MSPVSETGNDSGMKTGPLVGIVAVVLIIVGVVIFSPLMCRRIIAKRKNTVGSEFGKIL